MSVLTFIAVFLFSWFPYLAALCFLVITMRLFWRFRTGAVGRVLHVANDSCCQSARCVRCRMYRQILDTAFIRYRDNDSVTSDRIKTAVTICASEGSARGNSRVPSSWLSAGQRPNVFAVQGLTAQPWHDVQEFGQVLDILESPQTLDMLRKEFTQIYSHPLSVWQTNQTPSGEWHVFHLVNQGQKIKQNCNICPKSWSLLQSLPLCCMVHSVFGNASFSVVKPGCHISSHCGPTNIRLRCHVPLFVPDHCSLRVGTTTRVWIEEKCVIFDDSFEHEVWHRGNTNSGDRVIFMFDLWHPDLTRKERATLDMLFSPKS